MNDDAWDDLCVNPHEGAREKGRREGHEAGKMKGFEDGMNLGNIKGVEFGMELGFLRGIVHEIETEFIVHPGQQERISKSIKELKHMITTFPSPDELFKETSNEKLDLSARLQRVRAKYKVLTVQLHIPYVTLKDVLNEQRNQGTSPGTSEW